MHPENASRKTAVPRCGVTSDALLRSYRAVYPSDMDRDALETLRKHEGELRRRGVRHAAPFGSVARGEAHAGSNLDVMIEIDEAEVRTVYDYVRVVSSIEDLFPMKVDVANGGTLKDRIRVRAERDAIAAF
jgi:hypothetical protein